VLFAGATAGFVIIVAAVAAAFFPCYGCAAAAAESADPAAGAAVAPLLLLLLPLLLLPLPRPVVRVWCLRSMYLGPSPCAHTTSYEFGHGLSYTTFESNCSVATSLGGGGAATAATAAPDVVTVQANASFEVQLQCATRLLGVSAESSSRMALSALSAPLSGDEILLAFHRPGPDVRAAVAAQHPIPKFSLRDFERVDGVSHAVTVRHAEEEGEEREMAPGTSTFFVRPLDLALVNAVGASVM
jgi:hypothetical protein